MKHVLTVLLIFIAFTAIAQIRPVNSNLKVQPRILTTANQSTSNTQNVYQPASRLITDGKEPAGLQGYIAWIDPVSLKKHFIMGQDNRSGEWKYAYEYPSITVEFSKNGAIEWVGLSSGNYYVPVDSAGRELSRYSADWGTVAPAAFKYNIIFQFDLNYAGSPVVLDDMRTIRYNPSLYKFYDIKISLPFLNANNTSGITVPLGDFPDRPIEQKRRASKFTDLPNF